MANSPDRTRPARPPALEPFYFGSKGLYGCLHPVAGADRGVVICSPLGHEYITMHRALRQLATQISRGGCPTLRFDYSGTGDSAGNLATASLDQWLEDVDLAASELRRRAGTERLTLVGVRLGASLALQAAARRDDVEALALWDPVVSGRLYLRELRVDQRRMLRVAHVEQRKKPQSRTEELLGFRLGSELLDQIRGLALDVAPDPGVDRILLLETQRSSTAPLGASLRAAGNNLETRTEAVPHLWRWSEDITRVQLPHALVRAVAQWTLGATS